MTEVFALMSPSCLMKLCFEITAGRGARGVSAGNVRSWSLFLSMWNTCKLVEKRTMVVSSVCVCVCVCVHAHVVHFQQTYLSGIALNVALPGNTADGQHGNKEMGAFLLHTLSDSLEKTLMLGKIEGKRRQQQRMT